MSRIIREAVSNIIKHAPSTTMILQLANGADDEIILTIANDNVDGHPDSWEKVRGLNNMQVRAAEIGATLSMQKIGSYRELENCLIVKLVLPGNSDEARPHSRRP